MFNHEARSDTICFGEFRCRSPDEVGDSGRPQQVPMAETPSLGHGIVTPSVRGAVQRKCDQYENEFERVKCKNTIFICWTESEQHMNITWDSALLTPRLHWAPCMSAPLADFFVQLSTNARTAEVAPTGGCRKYRKEKERSTMKPTIIKLSSNYHHIIILSIVLNHSRTRRPEAWRYGLVEAWSWQKDLLQAVLFTIFYHHHCDYHWNFHPQQTLANAARACASSEMCRFRGTESDT